MSVQLSISFAFKVLFDAYASSFQYELTNSQVKAIGYDVRVPPLNFRDIAFL